MRRRDGSYQWTDGQACTRSGVVDVHAGYLVVLTDATGGVGAEKRYRLMAEALGDVVASSNSEGVIQWISLSVVKILGWSPEELVGRVVFDLVHPDDLQAVLDREKDLQASERVTREARVKTKDGTYRWVESTVSLVTDQAGEVVERVAAWRDIDDAVCAREALARSESRLRSTLDSLLDPHVVLDAVRDENGRIVDFVFVDANQAACDFNRLPREQLVGKRFLSQHPEAEGADLLAMYRRVVEEGEPLRLDNWRYAFEPGGTREGVYDVRAAKVGDGLVRTWRDVSDRFVAEKQLAESEARYRLVADNSVDIVAQADQQRIIRWISPSITESLGWAPDELEGTPVHELVHPADLGYVHSRRVEGSSRGLMTGEARLRHKDGTYKWFSAASRVVRDPETGDTGYVGGWHDISERKAAEERLERSEAMLRSTMDNMLEGCQIVDHDWNYVYVNPQAEIHNRRTRAELLGRNYFDIWPDVRSLGLFPLLERCMNERTVERAENVYVFADGHEAVFELVFQPVPEGMLILSTDVTEHRLAERGLAEKAAQLYEAQKLEAVGLLAGGMAHQFNNRLASILAAADLLMGDPKLAESDASGYVDLIKRETERAAGITRGMLDLAQKQMVQPAVVPVNQLVLDAKDDLGAALGDKAELMMSLHPQAGRIAIDRRQFTIMMDHLVTNARDAMAERGRVLIETSSTDVSGETLYPSELAECVLVKVSDNGAGIDPAVMAHLFEPFFTTKGEGKGIGLGLAVVRGIVRQAGGRVSISSELGHGTTVSMLFPQVEPPSR